MGQGDRLLEAIRSKGYNKLAEFARAVGVKEVTLRQQINRQSIPPKAADKYSRKLAITMEWLLSGRGKISPTSSYAPTESAPSDVSIAVYSSPLSFGNKGAPVAPDVKPLYYFSLSKAWLDKITLSPAKSLMFWRHSGNSMEPTFFTGDLILCDLSINSFEGDSIYLVRAGDLIQLKRIVLDSTGQFIVKNDNPTYEAIKVSKKKLEILGKRVGMITGRDN